MASPQGRPPVRDALVFREDDDGRAWVVRTIRAAQVPLYEGKGWTVLISAPTLDEEIAEAYLADRDRPFNPPRRR